MKRDRIKAQFESEAALCAAFIDHLPDHWLVYPETKGFDIVLAHRGGVQIGIEAKLTLNAKVVEQSMPSLDGYSQTSPGPDFRAVLVPYGVSSTLQPICTYLGITVICQHDEASREKVIQYRTNKNWYTPVLPDEFDEMMTWRETWFDTCPWQRLTLPDYIPDVQAGAKSPMRLTQWKVKAIKLAVTLEKRGFLTRADFKHHSVSITRWTQPPNAGWLLCTERRGVYARNGDRFPDFRAQHPTNYAEIEADYEVWKSPEGTPPMQRQLFDTDDGECVA